MNFKQRNLYVLLDGPMGEYPLKLCFVYLILKHLQCSLFFLHIMHGRPCIGVLQNLNVKAQVTNVNL